MAKRKQRDALYAYLDKQGVLVSGDEHLIQAAKQKYWAQYKKEWRKQQRKENKAYTIYFNPKEHTCIRKAAVAQSISPTRFIKQASLSMVGKDSFVDPALLGKIREVLARCITDVEELLVISGISMDREDTILKRMEQLEDQVLNLIAHPQSKR
jgi:hypothetical protein